MTFRTRSSCVSSTKLVFLQIPDIGSFPAGPRPELLAPHHPRTHPFSDPCQPSGLQQPAERHRCCQFSLGIGKVAMPRLWAGCAPPRCPLPTAKPGAALPLLNARTSQGEQTGGCDAR